MVEATKCPNTRYYIDLLRGGRRLRQFISLSSHANLNRAAGNNPDQIEQLLLVLEKRQGQTVELAKLIVIREAGSPYNRQLLAGLAEKAGELVKEDGTLDMRQAGLLTIAEPSLAREIEVIRRARGELIKKAELADLALFRALVAARAELFILGEEKSAARIDEDVSLYQERCQAMRDFAGQLSKLMEVFPYGSQSYRTSLREGIEIARDRTAELNNPAAESKLTSLIERLAQDLDEQEKDRIAASKNRKSRNGLQIAGGKVRIIDDLRGNCIITTRGYKNSAAGILHKEMVENDVSTKKILSMIGHQIESVEQEKTVNQKHLADLNAVEQDPAGSWNELLRINAALARVRDLGKQKARAELWAAMELSLISTDQAQRLARSLVSLAVTDLERRQEVLDAQLASLTRLKGLTEELIGKVLLALAQRWARYFAKEPRLNSERLKKIRFRLGKYLGTLLGPKKEELREEWMKQARSHITGILRMMGGINALFKQAAELRARAQNAATPGIGIEKELAVVQEKIAGKLDGGECLKAARLILRIEFDFVNREKQFTPSEKKTALAAFYREKAKVYGAKIAFVSKDA